ncbi:EAL and HDOD domain-containing protein [Sulfurirhabdus autotrophica]|uniref:EAL and modified HD-GYP domain-containing signal transduction protein n=1 Tax=Sulfurirhabdus autotrophica TaxID=1706046 RepID=A0A4R3Y7D8_9PROT|nr:HDOD domain-containing protein [Sulfurirhabdus autotrophica]TCV87431.1 EAL and modified HD-GYP domain-containing signal transduction protein [Sulfurirhabdus autotrophica]
MFSKLMNFRKGKKSTSVKQSIDHEEEESHLEGLLIDAEKPVSNQPSTQADRVVDTHKNTADTIVTSVLEIDTHGKSSGGQQLRQRILGRQPVLDKYQHVVGYELILRNKDANQAFQQNTAISRLYDDMLLRGLGSMELAHSIGQKSVFAGLSYACIPDALLEEVPSRGVVLALKIAPEHIEDQLLCMKNLITAGFQVAVDDFIYSPVFAPFYRLAKYVRIDVSGMDAISLREQMKSLREKVSPLLIAKNVETDDVFDACRSLSFDFFQGYYFTKLQPNKPPRLNNDRLRVIELLNMVTKHAEIHDLEKVFKLDVSLSYKLLRYINSPGCGMVQKVSSIAHALAVLGYDQLYRWLTLLLFTSGKIEARSHPLLKNAMVRARLIESLGEMKLAPSEVEGLFIVGIFSMLDALLNVPMEQAISHLNLPEKVVDALVNRKGGYAPFLELASACEEGNDQLIEHYAAACHFDADTVNHAHVQAIIWAEELDK